MTPNPLTVSEMVRLLDGELLPGGERRAEETISGVAALADAGPADASFFGNPKYLADLRRTRATAVLVPAEFPTPEPTPDAGPAFVRVTNPSVAFGRLVERFCPPPPVYAPGVAPTALVGRDVTLGPDVSIQAYAVIEDRACIGAGTFIGAGVFVGAGSEIGASCRIYPHVTIREGTRIGQRVIIHSGAVIGADGFGFEQREGRHVKIPQIGFVQIDDDVEIGANSAIDRARFGRTHIAEGAKIDNLVQIAHNVTVGPHNLICAQSGISGSTRLGRHVILAGQVGIVGHVEIGDQAILTAQSGISKSVPANTTIFGHMGEPIREAMEKTAMVRRLPKLNARVRKLEEELEKLKGLLADDGKEG